MADYGFDKCDPARLDEIGELLKSEYHMEETGHFRPGGRGWTVIPSTELSDWVFQVVGYHPPFSADLNRPRRYPFSVQSYGGHQEDGRVKEGLVRLIALCGCTQVFSLTGKPMDMSEFF